MPGVLGWNRSKAGVHSQRIHAQRAQSAISASTATNNPIENVLGRLPYLTLTLLAVPGNLFTDNNTVQLSDTQRYVQLPGEIGRLQELDQDGQWRTRLVGELLQA
jgi:hypothetical protein